MMTNVPRPNNIIKKRKHKRHYKFPINDRAHFCKCRSHAQECIYCGSKILNGTINVCLNNNTDSMKLKKNLWVHIRCFKDLSNLVYSQYEKYRNMILLEVI